MVRRMPSQGRGGGGPIIHSAVTVFFLTLLCTLSGGSAGETPGAHGSPPALLAAPPERALVYFVNDLYPGETHIYFDDKAVGILPWNSYTTAFVVPGVRLVWGTSEARRYEFKAGWAYLLRLVKVGPFATAWAVDNPGIVGALVADKKLAYVTTDTDALTRMSATAEARYGSAAKAAGPALALPFQRRFHTLELPEKRGRAARAAR